MRVIVRMYFQLVIQYRLLLISLFYLANANALMYNFYAIHVSACHVQSTRFLVLQHVFRFDEVFGASCGNDGVYSRAVKPLVQCAFNR